MEIIENVTEFYDKVIEGYNSRALHDGFEIVTNKSVYKFSITSQHQCCEEFGILITEDKPSDFIGAEVKNVVVTDDEFKGTLLDTSSLNEPVETVFITFNTSNGPFQIVAYNSHDGFYGHTVLYTINDKTVNEFEV